MDSSAQSGLCIDCTKYDRQIFSSIGTMACGLAEVKSSALPVLKF